MKITAHPAFIKAYELEATLSGLAEVVGAT
jgi:hypothetical protein